MYLIHGKYYVFDKVVPFLDGEFCSFFKDHYQDYSNEENDYKRKGPMKIVTALCKI